MAFAKIATMISFLSSLFGGAVQAQNGPDIANGQSKVVHIGQTVSVHYEMPGNMSRQFNFAAIYQRDTAKSYQVDPHKLAKAETLTWRELEFIDVGKWDYTGKKSEGPNGELGSLRLDVSYSVLPNGVALEDYIKASYERYLNGPKGLNQKFLKDENGQPTDPEDYEDMAAKAPTSFSYRDIGGGKFLTWQTDQEFDGYRNTPYVYYVLPVEQAGFLTFLFSSTISVYGEKMVARQNRRIAEDIQHIIEKIKVDKKEVQKNP